MQIFFFRIVSWGDFTMVLYFLIIFALFYAQKWLLYFKMNQVAGLETGNPGQALCKPHSLVCSGCSMDQDPTLLLLLHCFLLA